MNHQHTCTRHWRKWIGLILLAQGLASALPAAERPNILFCIADDWGWPHAGAYGDPVVKTPAFDRLAQEGVLFQQAYVSAPSCTPCRNAILTGQHFYRLEAGADLWSMLPRKFPVYPLLLEQAGYFIGHWRKSFGPGSLKAGGYTNQHPAGPRFRNFADFLRRRPAGKPFCFWLGSSDPHRPYKAGSGKASGMDLSRVPVPKFYPDDEVIRSDIADYYWEVQRFDRDVAAALKLLEDAGELDNTLIVMTGDHGMPFPRCKANVYDWSARVPLAMRWGKKIKPGRQVTDFVSFVDFAPTFLAAAGVAIPDQMTGRPLLNVLLSDRNGRVEAGRDRVIIGRERHVPAQQKPSLAGYPVRAVRTDRWLYIWNLKPDLWPAGVPAPGNAFGSRRGYADCDDGPTKFFLIDHKDDPQYRRYFALSFAKRPAEELYDCAADPYQTNNLAGRTALAKTQARLRSELKSFLKQTGDPRLTGQPHPFDTLPYPLRD